MRLRFEKWGYRQYAIVRGDQIVGRLASATGSTPKGEWEVFAAGDAGFNRSMGRRYYFTNAKQLARELLESSR